MMSYQTLLQEAVIEIEIKKSRFIGHACPCQTAEEAEAYIQKIKDLHRQSNHNCLAYIVGSEGIQQRYSDDGEPQGSAGIPMLEVLRKEGLKNCVVVVTRYFGGIKLGASGLVRAYTKTCREAVESAKIVTYETFTRTGLEFGYELLGKIDYYMQANRLFEVRRDFSDRVYLEWLVLLEDEDKVVLDLMNLSSGSCKIDRLELRSYPVDRDKKIIL